ncbi:site-specific integrase [Brevibacillus halotolerans]|uniref:site-specific integrase n=1 Tax=Brevibacillus TaxID=55080 RepID=UPI00215C90C4|nr:site-specific integrase [Brevibacillus laterosporus]MCR8964074.1 site-specific integrase [Brevibacillus laterosporus]MCZ0836229.1 site-specific integrase [Brevibacillus halotolerans]
MRQILTKYSEEAGLVPHKLRHFLLTWLKKQGIDDALIQPYSGHESRKSLEVYSKLAITDAQQEYNGDTNMFTKFTIKYPISIRFSLKKVYKFVSLNNTRVG